MKINWTVRLKNPIWWVQIIAAVLCPILAYAGLTYENLTSWPYLGQVLLEAVMNPYVCGLVAISVWNACNDPTTKGLGDGALGSTYTKPM